MIDPLLVYLRPKDIHSVLMPMNKIKSIDKLYINYYYQREAYQIARETFLKGTWTHLMIITNDVILYQKDVKLLIAHLKRDLPVVCCGIMNVDQKELKEYANISYGVDFDFILFDQLEDVLKIRIKWCGFPLICIQREVVKLVKFRQDSNGHNTDLMFCYDLDRLNLPIWCYPQIKLNHLRYYGAMLTGVKEPSVDFIAKLK